VLRVREPASQRGVLPVRGRGRDRGLERPDPRGELPVLPQVGHGAVRGDGDGQEVERATVALGEVDGVLDVVAHDLRAVPRLLDHAVPPREVPLHPLVRLHGAHPAPRDGRRP